MFAFTKKELARLKKLNTPAKVQDFLNSIPFNFEKNKNKAGKSVGSSGGLETLKSPLFTLRENNAHCFEGALLGAFILSLSGHKPLVMTLASTKEDYDHVVAPFKINGLWGALSKTNHAVLRYREPVYKTIRELAMSYFHEYFLNDGTKTLRRYSEPLDLNEFENNWIFSDGNLWGIEEELDKKKHWDMVPKNYLKRLRKADLIEREAGGITEWRPNVV